MPDYAVSTAFKGKDNVSHLFHQMERAAGRFGDTAQGSFRKTANGADHASTALRNASKHGYNFGAIVKGILAANAIRGGIGMIGSGFQKIGSDYLEFGDVITGAVARFDEVDTRSAAFGTAIEKSGKQVRNSVLGTRHSAVDAAQAFNELAKAGYNSNSALAILPNLAAFATAAQEKLADATTMSSDILGGFGLRNDNVAIQLKNHTRLNDQLTKSALLATGDMRDMFETMQVVAPISKEMGMAQETALALSVALSNAGIKGSEAATAIKRGMLQIYSSGKEAEFNVNGVFPFDKAGNPRKFTAVLGEMAKAMDKLTPQQRIPILRDVFGVYGLAGQIKLMRELKAISEYENKIQNSDGLSKRMADAANTSPLAKLKILGGAALEKGFQVLDQYAEKGKTGIQTLIDKVNKFDVRPLIQALDLTGRTLWSLYKIAEPFLPLIPPLAEAFVAWKVAVMGWGAAMAAIKLAAKVKLFWDIGAALTAGLGPMKAMTTAVGYLGAKIAVAMAPIIAASGPIAALAAILGVSYATSSTMKENGWGDNRSGDQLLDEARKEKAKQAGWVAPNAKEAQARSVGFNGLLTIAGAPQGSTYKGSTFGGSPLEVNMLGANP